MSRGINKVTLIGNLGRDPEIRYTNSDVAVCNVTLATSRSYRDRETSEEVEKTDWHRLVFFNRLAEIVSEYLTKGSKIYIEGRLQTREWDDQKSGEKRYMTEVVVQEMVMLDRRNEGRGDSASRAPEPSGGGGAPGDNYGGRSGGPDGAGGPGGGGGGPGGPGGGEFDDDIPF